MTNQASISLRNSTIRITKIDYDRLLLSERGLSVKSLLLTIHNLSLRKNEESQSKVKDKDLTPNHQLNWPCRKDLTKAAKCNTLLDMKSATLTIRLDKDLNVLLSKASKRSGKNRSEIAREALRRQLRLQQFEELRKRIMPFAEARGFLTDEDIFSQIS